MAGALGARTVVQTEESPDRTRVNSRQKDYQFKNIIGDDHVGSLAVKE
jgi:hypothetical protein